MAFGLSEGKLWHQTLNSAEKTNLVSYPARAVGLVSIYLYIYLYIFIYISMVEGCSIYKERELNIIDRVYVSKLKLRTHRVNSIGWLSVSCQSVQQTKWFSFVVAFFLYLVYRLWWGLTNLWVIFGKCSLIDAFISCSSCVDITTLLFLVSSFYHLIITIIVWWLSGLWRVEIRKRTVGGSISGVIRERRKNNKKKQTENLWNGQLTTEESG